LDEIKSSEYWHGDGRNNIIFISQSETENTDNVGRAILIGPNIQQPRYGFDISLPYNQFMPTIK